MTAARHKQLDDVTNHLHVALLLHATRRSGLLRVEHQAAILFLNRRKTGYVEIRPRSPKTLPWKSKLSKRAKIKVFFLYLGNVGVFT